MERGPYGWRDGQRPSPRFHGAVYPDDVSHLAGRNADILITHEAPGCHHHGWDALSQLARDMDVIRSFHGHTHDDLSGKYALMRDQLGFDPDGHPKLLHLWPVKLLQAGRSDYDYVGVMAMREAASFKR